MESASVSQDQPRPFESAGYASFWQRLAAYALDALIGGVLLNALIGLLGISTPGDPGFDAGQWDLFVTVAAFAYVAVLALLEGSTLQATPGKLVLGLRVAAASNREPIGSVRGLLRRLVLLPAVAIVGLGVLAIFRSPRNQGWHDHAAKAVVLSIR